MPLALYRRHRRECKAGHAEDFRSSEYDERKKGWRRCECPILASGTLSGKFRRHNTGKWEWEPARALAERIEAAGSWTAPTPEEPKPDSVPAPVERVTIVEATEAYLARCQNRVIEKSTLAKYKTLVNQLCAYAKSRGYVYLDQLGVADMDLFSATWKDGIRAKARKLHRLKTFVKFCLKRKWMKEDIASDLETPQGSSTVIPKSPFTDEELERIYAACDAIGGPVKPGPGFREWTGDDVKDFVYLSIYTGLRISDVATFDITKRLDGNDVFLRMHKTKKAVYTWIPDWLVNRLREREKREGALILRCGVVHTMKQLTDTWRNKRLARVFKIAGPFEERVTPHKFRHTFVRILLEKGVPVADVADLIGDTEETVRTHYSKWIRSRQVRLSAILQDAFRDQSTPRPVEKVVAIR